MTPEQELRLKRMEEFRVDMQKVDPNCVKADGKIHPAFQRDPLAFKFAQSTFLFGIWEAGRVTEKLELAKTFDPAYRELQELLHRERDERKAEEARLTQALAARPEIDMAALRRVLVALTGAPHEVRELQVMRSLPDSPIDTLINQFNAWSPPQKADT